MVVHTVLFIFFSFMGTEVQYVFCTAISILETGGPYCPIYSFHCRANSGSIFLYMAVSVKRTVVYTVLYIAISVVGKVVHTVMYKAISDIGMVVYTFRYIVF